MLTRASTQKGLPPLNSPSGPNNDMTVVKVAMLSMTSQNWSRLYIPCGILSRLTVSPITETASPTLAVHNVDLGYTSESRGTPPLAAPGSLRVQVSTIRGDTNNHDVSLVTEHGDSAPTTLQDLGDSAPLDRGYDDKYFVFLSSQCSRNLFSC